jgi:hypothetical protein
MVRHCLFALTLLVFATGAEAASQSRKLSAKEMRQRLIGKVITDNAHWHYYLKPNGSIDADELNRSRKGHWHLEGDRLCIIIIAGAAPDECWDVAQDGEHLTFGTYGEVTYWVKVEPPPKQDHRAKR